MNRIHELETFYEENIHDLRITNFEKARLRLKKLLMYDVETLNKIDNTGNNYAQFSQSNINQFSSQNAIQYNNK
jgi:hypothetical protein